MDPELSASLPPLMLGGSLWAIRADGLPRVLELARAFGNRDAQSRTLGHRGALAGPPSTLATDAPGVAVIPLTGVLTPHGSFLSYLFGGGFDGVQGFRDQLARAAEDPSVAAIVLDVDSPGGSVGLIPEAAADVRAARDIKPVYAVANTQAASGAFWIAAQATEFYASPSAMVGSVGVYYMHADWSKANADMGVDVSYIHAGEYKTEGNPDEPLSDAARAAWQADADNLYAQFVSDIAAGRDVSAETVRSDYGQGRPLLAQDALAAGMIDGVETIQAILARSLSDATAGSGPSARRLGRAAVHRTEPRAAAADPTDPGPELPDPTHVPDEAPDPGDLEPDPQPVQPDEPEPVAPESADAEARRQVAGLLFAA